MRVAIPIAVALVLGGATQPALAQTGGATVSKDLGCGGFVPTSTGGVGAIIYSDESVVLITGNGSTSLTCHFDVPAGLEPATTTRAAGFACYTFLGLTYDSRMQASSGGNATLSCRVRN